MNYLNSCVALFLVTSGCLDLDSLQSGLKNQDLSMKDSGLNDSGTSIDMISSTGCKNKAASIMLKPDVYFCTGTFISNVKNQCASGWSICVMNKLTIAECGSLSGVGIVDVPENQDTTTVNRSYCGMATGSQSKSWGACGKCAVGSTYCYDNLNSTGCNGFVQFIDCQSTASQQFWTCLSSAQDINMVQNKVSGDGVLCCK